MGGMDKRSPRSLSMSPTVAERLTSLITRPADMVKLRRLRLTMPPARVVMLPLTAIRHPLTANRHPLTADSLIIRLSP